VLRRSLSTPAHAGRVSGGRIAALRPRPPIVAMTGEPRRRLGCASAGEALRGLHDRLECDLVELAAARPECLPRGAAPGDFARILTTLSGT
jgi:hypothetical protein